MTQRFIRTLDDIREEQEALLETSLDPDMALISDYLAGELSEQQAGDVRARIEKDADFRDMAEPLLLAYEYAPPRKSVPLDAMRDKWLQLRERIGLPPVAGTAASNDPAIARFRETMAREKRKARRATIAAIAALLVITVMPLTIPFVMHIGDGVRTAYGSTTVVPMEDGSRALVAGGSRLVRGPQFGTYSREVTLTGEAAFEVAHGSIPFVVWTGAASITVTGTKFTVHAYEYEPTVVDVLEGTVSLRGRDEDGSSFGPVLTVGPGQRATVTRGFAPKLEQSTIKHR